MKRKPADPSESVDSTDPTASRRRTSPSDRGGEPISSLARSDRVVDSNRLLYQILLAMKAVEVSLGALVAEIRKAGGMGKFSQGRRR